MLNKPFQSPGITSFLDNLRRSRLQAMFRRGELALVVLGVCTGIMAGLLVSLVRFLSESLHYWVFGVDDTLSGSQVTGPIVLLGPVIGGILLGLLVFILSKTRKKPMVDPIEANAPAWRTFISHR